ncbi:MAG: 23S rRNA (pseudouridine(1915)-N(3))-methyltransferase RlmH [Bacillota bacterium]|nr:23S rRNA (pseudouridine(1915)-N(3))-methyltransferase RlmH [Bacillota bacterium]
MKIRILAIGKIKESYLKAAVADYEKRLKPYLKLEILEGPEEDAPERLSEAEKKQVMTKEGRYFLTKMKEGDFNIALDLNGKNLTSPELAQIIADKAMMEGKTINFVIGGSLGISEEVKEKCRFKIAFGKATFPHQLIRLFLTEQIYRSMKIIKNEPYHK